MRIGKIIFLYRMFDVRYSNYFSSRLYANTSVTSSEWDFGYYPTQMRWILPCG